MQQQNSLAKFATLVFHLHPDLEVCVVDWLIRVYAEICQSALGFDGVARVKFIPSGPLRVEDWSEFGGCVDHEALFKKYGVVFIDAGYGRQPLDQHRQSDCHEVSSIERFVSLACEAGADLIWLMALVRVVAANDLYGSDTAAIGHETRDSATPHTPRHLRNLIGGLNLILKQKPAEELKPGELNGPERVLQLVHMALNGVAKALPDCLAAAEMQLELHFGQEGTSFEVRLVQREKAENDQVKKLFTWGQLLKNVEACYAERPEYIKYFKDMAEVAFQALEQQWLIAERDYWDKNKCRVIENIRLDPAAFGLDSRRNPVTVAILKSKSTRGGDMTRRGNEPRWLRQKLIPEPMPGQPLRKKADFTIQILEEGPDGTKFQISTRKVKDVAADLRPISYELRLADLRRRHFCLEVTEDNSLFIYGGQQTMSLVQKMRSIGLDATVDSKDRDFVRIYRHGKRISDIARAISRAVSQSVYILDQLSFGELAEVGNNLVTVRNTQWEQVSLPVMYIADFASVLGNAFNTNPFAPRTILSAREIINIFFATLERSHREMRQATEQAADAS
ncbi:MAG: hypothetical protein V1738_02650 [Patescibacteria group bacterium]